LYSQIGSFFVPYLNLVAEDIFLVPDWQPSGNLETLITESGLKKEKALRFLEQTAKLTSGIFLTNPFPKDLLTVDVSFEPTGPSWFYEGNTLEKAYTLCTTEKTVVFISKELGRDFGAALYFRQKLKRTDNFFSYPYGPIPPLAYR
jgi:hypothetical protein